MSELASALACTGSYCNACTFLPVSWGELENFADAVPCTRPCAQVVKLARIASLQIMLVRLAP